MVALIGFNSVGNPNNSRSNLKSVYVCIRSNCRINIGYHCFKIMDTINIKLFQEGNFVTNNAKQHMRREITVNVG